jgi:hypothetical protein
MVSGSDIDLAQVKVACPISCIGEIVNMAL